MAWILGMNLGRTAEGAIAFAKWFVPPDPSGGPPAIGVHVLEEEHLLYVLRDHHLDEVVKSATEELGRRVQAAGAGTVIGGLRVEKGLQASETLEEVRAETGSEGVIVGRAAATGGLHVVRLGRVPRRLARTLGSTVVVVPPELDAKGIGDGPLIALTDLKEDSAEACRFAAAAADRLGRKWLAVHVVRAVEAEYLPYESRERARLAQRDAAVQAAEAWLSSHSLRPDRVVVETGSILETGCEVAIRERTPLLVTGSRRLTVGERAIQTSFGSALAATAPVPVAIVPPR